MKRYPPPRDRPSKCVGCGSKATDALRLDRLGVCAPCSLIWMQVEAAMAVERVRFRKSAEKAEKAVKMAEYVHRGPMSGT